MKREYTDILFALYINGGQATLGWLVDFLGDSKTDPREVHRNIGVLVSAKLLVLFIKDDQVCVALTDDGNRAALAAADILSSRMLEQWQQMQAA